MPEPPAEDMRLNRFLASCGLGSRRSCEALITEGRVEVNGAVCTQLATRIGERDSVRVDGRVVRQGRETTLLLNKPRGYLCTRADPEARQTLFDLLPKRFHSLHSVGRLDLDSSGLILVTNSGKLTQELTHPRHEIEKEYLVALDQRFDSRDTERLQEGIQLAEALARAESIRVLSNKQLRVVLRQGLNRQIRRMFTALGYTVKTLERIRIGCLIAPDLAPGDWRPLNSRDLEAVRKNPA